MKKYIFLSMVLLFCFAQCTPTQDVGQPTPPTPPKADGQLDNSSEDIIEEKTTAKCATNGIVRNMAGLDGCGFLIELEDGRKVEPVVMEDKSFKFKDGQKIRFTYEQEREMMSVCMGGMTVRVTCIEVVK